MRYTQNHFVCDRVLCVDVNELKMSEEKRFFLLIFFVVDMRVTQNVNQCVGSPPLTRFFFLLYFETFAVAHDDGAQYAVRRRTSNLLNACYILRERKFNAINELLIVRESLECYKPK